MMNYSMRVYAVLLSCMVSNMYATTTLIDVMDKGLGYEIKKFLMDCHRDFYLQANPDCREWRGNSALIQLSRCSHYFLEDVANPNRIICVNLSLCNPIMNNHISADRFEEGIEKRFGKAKKIVIYNQDFSRSIDSEYFQKLRPYMLQITHMKIVYVDLVSIMDDIDLTSACNVVELNINCTFFETTIPNFVQAFVDYIGQQSKKLQSIFIIGLSSELQNRLREKLPAMEFPDLHALSLRKATNGSDINLDLISAFVAQTEKLEYIGYGNISAEIILQAHNDKLFMYDFVKRFVTQYPDKIKKLSQLKVFFVGPFLMKVIICNEAKQSEHFISMIKNIPNYNFFRIEIDPRDVPGWSEFKHDGCQSLQMAIVMENDDDDSIAKLVEACNRPFKNLCDESK